MAKSFQAFFGRESKKNIKWLKIKGKESFEDFVNPVKKFFDRCFIL
jgi:hypothetical protein